MLVRLCFACSPTHLSSFRISQPMVLDSVDGGAESDELQQLEEEDDPAEDSSSASYESPQVEMLHSDSDEEAEEEAAQHLLNEFDEQSEHESQAEEVPAGE